MACDAEREAGPYREVRSHQVYVVVDVEKNVLRILALRVVLWDGRVHDTVKEI
jgi:hypothetical protein